MSRGVFVPANFVSDLEDLVPDAASAPLQTVIDRLMIFAGAMHSDCLVRNISGAPFHPVVHAHLAHRTKRFIIKGRYTQRRPQFLIEFAQIREMRSQSRYLVPVVRQKKFLIARIPQSRKSPVQHDGRLHGHLVARVSLLAKFRAASVLFHSHHAARAAYAESERRQTLDRSLRKPLINIPHSNEGKGTSLPV